MSDHAGKAEFITGKGLSLSAFWRMVSYKSKPAEFLLYFLAVSGLCLWDGFDLPWLFQRTSLAIHVIVSILLFPIFVLPFWLAHREILSNSSKSFLRGTGQVIDYCLFALLLSGLYLVFFGKTGNLPGELAYWLHLLPAVPLTIMLAFHAKRWSMWRSLTWLIAFILAMLVLIGTSFAANESGSLVIGDRGSKLFSANFDAGSVSWIDRGTGERLGEVRTGGEPRRLALDADNLIGVTDDARGRVVFVDWKKSEVANVIDLGGRPFGIVYDERHGLFWVTLFEEHKIAAVHPSRGVLHILETEETPRGLASLSDGRLLVTHAMVGKVSVYDTRNLPPVRTRVIDLHESQDPNELISQGLPRLLDDIAVSPDEREAWLPHLLWNFDHLFQFQSTIFPALSVLRLEPGRERELVLRRKHLFRQINIPDGDKLGYDGKPKAMIVSNPHDAAFSEDGKAVYVTLAASEDLMVFDLSDRTPPADAGMVELPEGPGDAKAVQILRHLPGRNPRGLVVQGENIFVQNAMSLDLSRLDRSESGREAKVRLAEAEFARLVDHDPIDPGLRRGRELFYTGNTDRHADLPMTGDFWMSCQSCHVDGFNFTNGYLYRGTVLDKYKYARIGHGNLSKMIAGDFVGDYLRIIQETQGGMGHDGEGSAEFIDPDDPPGEAVAMMADLHLEVTAKDNLPLVSTWLRLEDERRTVHESEWTNSAACAECHSDMFDQWADSLHRLMGDSNPYYKVLEDVAAEAEGEDFRKWCMGCHHPQGLLSGLERTSNDGHMFEKGGASLFEALGKGRPDLDEGTGCLFCHRITKLESAQGRKAGANASFTVNLKDRESFVFEDAANPVLNWVGNHSINAKPDHHTRSYSQDFYQDSALCSSCHVEIAPGSGALIVDTYSEWERSPFNNPEDPGKHRSCIDCHMHGDIAKIGSDIPGISTDGGRVKENVVTHQFTGANYHLVGLRNKKLEQMSIELLRSAAKLEASLTSGGGLAVRVRNVGAGHALPTGVADFRQVWLDVSVRDAVGSLVLESGKMDGNGVVDADARFFQKVFGDKYGNPVGFNFWRYEKMLKDTKIPAGGHRDEVFDLPADTRFPVEVDVKLMFRTYPQAVTDIVRKSYPDLTDPEAIVMDQLNLTLGD